MADRRVRIYEGNNPNATTIGFSMSATDAPDNPAFSTFMQERGYEWRDLPLTERPVAGFSWRYVEVCPPLTDVHIKELGQLCVGGNIGGTLVQAIVESHHNSTLVYDNRQVLPIGAYGGGELIARG